MAQLLAGIRLRVFAVAFEGYGQSGERGADGIAKSVPADTFRPTLDSAPLDDPEAALGMIDRACSFRWLATRDKSEPWATQDAQQYRVSRFELTNAVVQGVGNEHGINDDNLTGTDATYAVTYPDERALSDAEQLATALGYAPLIASDTTDDPCLIDCHREGESQLIPAPGMVLCRTVYVVQWRFNSTVAHDAP